MTTADLRLAVTGQTIRSRWDLGVRRTSDYIKPGALTHLTDGTPNSPTGRNLRALCGVSVRPETDIEGLDDGVLCSRCREAKLRLEAGR